jgi:hypothetical protein
MNLLEPPRERLNTEELLNRSKVGNMDDDHTHKQTMISGISQKDTSGKLPESENGGAPTLLSFIYDDMT